MYGTDGGANCCHEVSNFDIPGIPASKRAYLHKPSKSGGLIHFIILIKLLGTVKCSLA
jgi:hypothetical protein